MVVFVEYKLALLGNTLRQFWECILRNEKRKKKEKEKRKSDTTTNTTPHCTQNT